MSKVLSVIIPVYNEENTVLKILNELEKVILINNIKKEYILVNDCLMIILKILSTNTL